jgi:hypothetical protein
MIHVIIFYGLCSTVDHLVKLQEQPVVSGPHFEKDRVRQTILGLKMWIVSIHSRGIYPVQVDEAPVTEPCQ